MPLHAWCHPISCSTFATPTLVVPKPHIFCKPVSEVPLVLILAWFLMLQIGSWFAYGINRPVMACRMSCSAA